jgi:NAD(P)-dependent dehydrogenase (short-subunit alcohol dehydrogenase family)
VKERGIAVCTVHPGYVQTDMGGPDADITALESASGIRDVAARMTLENSGTFWKWNGEVHPW